MTGTLKMFEDEADTIFKAAGVEKEGLEFLWEQCANIMSQKMASLSPMGLTKKRVELYNEQRDVLINDLIAAQKDGTLKKLKEESNEHKDNGK